MKKLIMTTVAAALVAVVSTNAMAAADAGKFGVIDVQKIFASSPKVTAQKKSLMSEFTSKRDKLQASQKSLQAMMTKYKRNATVMSQSQKQALQTQIAAAQTKLMQMGHGYQQQAEQAQAQAMQKFVGQLKTAAATVAKKDNLAMILPTNAVIYAGDSMDVTKQVASAFNG